MELVEVAFIEEEIIMVIDNRSLLKRLCSDPLLENLRYAKKYPGKIEYNSIKILDTDDELILGKKIQEIEFDNFIFYGVLPVSNVDKPIMKCSIDYCEVLSKNKYKDYKNGS